MALMTAAAMSSHSLASRSLAAALIASSLAGGASGQTAANPAAAQPGEAVAPPADNASQATTNGPDSLGPGAGAIAHVHVYIGRTIWPGGSKAGIAGLRYDIGIDDGKPARLKSKHVAQFDLPPGEHHVTAYLQTLWGPMHPRTLDVSLAPGEDLYLRLDHIQAVSPGTMEAGAMFGIVGALVVVGMGEGKQAGGHPPGDWLDPDPDGAAHVAGLDPN
jgi:hypothetical protein